MTADEEAAEIRQAAQQMRLTVSNELAQRLVAFIDLLLRWNTTYNLTAIRDRTAMRLQHVNDCLAVVGPVQRHLQLTSARTTRLSDVGSGGGLPGVVLAIALPDTEVVCIDAVGKKAAFVQQAAVELGLSNLRSVHARVERCTEAPFDLVTSRAFASLKDFTQLTRHLVAPSGCWMAMKGKVPSDEIAELPPDIDVFHVEPLSVPGLGADRCAVWMRPFAKAA